MVLDYQASSKHNSMLGRRIPHPPSTNFDQDNDLPPAKRLKTFESLGDLEGSALDNSDEESAASRPQSRDEIPDSEEEQEGSDDEAPFAITRPTELENALPPIKTDKEAIADYEAMRAAEQEQGVSSEISERLSSRNWSRGRSSIYVDAFNLALETVLEDESHLFDEKEMEIFNIWRKLEYEAQYLYDLLLNLSEAAKIHTDMCDCFCGRLLYGTV